MENKLIISGKLYNQELEFLKDANNRNLVRGRFGILVDEKTQQVERVEVYISELTKAQKENRTYSLLKKLAQNKENFYENDKNKAVSVRAECNMIADLYYVEENGTLVQRTPRRNRLVFLNEDRATPMGAVFSLDCDIYQIQEVTDSKGMLTGEANLLVKHYNEYSGTANFRLRISNPDYLSIIQSRFIPGQPNLMKLGGRITDIVVSKEAPKESAFGVNAVSVSQNNVKVCLVESGDFLEITEGFATLKTTADQKKETREAEAKAKAQEKAKTPKTSGSFGEGTVNVAPSVGGFKF